VIKRGRTKMFDPEVEDVVKIGEEEFKVANVEINIYGNGVPEITLDNGKMYSIFETEVDAGEMAREYYENMAHNSPDELIDLVGSDMIVMMALGRGGDLNDWLDEKEDQAAEYFAIDGYTVNAEYNGKDYEGEVVLYLTEE